VHEQPSVPRPDSLSHSAIRHVDMDTRVTGLSRPVQFSHLPSEHRARRLCAGSRENRTQIREHDPPMLHVLVM
jgi:hypothetical protein